MFCQVIFGDQASKDSLRGVILGQIGHADLFEIFAGVALLGHLDGLVFEHVHVTHVPLLQLLLGFFDLVVVVLLQLLVRQPPGQDSLRTRVLFDSESLLLNLVLHGCLLVCLMILHVILSNFHS